MHITTRAHKMIKSIRFAALAIRTGFFVAISFVVPIHIPFMTMFFSMLFIPFLHKQDVLIANMLEGGFVFFRIGFYLPVLPFYIPAMLVYMIVGALLDYWVFFLFSRTKLFQRINRLLGGFYKR